LTPFTQHRDRMNGVETHAHILGNLIDRNSLVEVPASVRWGLSLCLAFLCLVLFLRNRVARVVLFWVLCTVTMSLAAFAVFAIFHVWFSPALPCVLLSFMFIIFYIFRLEQTGRELGEAKEEWEASFNTINDAIILMDDNGSVLRMNIAANTLLVPHILDLLARKCSIKGEECVPVPGGAGKNAVPMEEQGRAEEIYDATTDRHLEVKFLPRFDPQGRPSGFVHVVRDITVKKKGEEEKERLQFQLIQAQKMESIGRLAGGVAHDFNNILTAILGYSELALMKLSVDGSPRDYINIIHESGLKASALTRQLLAFSRMQVMEMQVVNLRDIVESIAKILGRIIGEDVTVKLRTETPLRNVLADPVQLEQILMNLAVNARDAMPRGGTMTIETADIELDEAYASSHEGVTPGSYVMLAVTDTGGGMNHEVQARIFEPFFTTKKVGEGTGLGLSTVFGIVKAMSGHIYVYSEEGKGSAFKVYLPVCREDAAGKAEAEALVMPRGTETILIAEDDTSIRKLLVDILEPLGYRVITAFSGTDAVRLVETSHTPVDLLLTDVVMPGMGGKELAQIFQSIYPHIKVLFMSGYTEEIIIQHGVEQDGVAFIQKPLIPNKLVLKLRAVLDK
jgi:two-component system cell cycle sensor histidine kinase/response regulator CckA